VITLARLATATLMTVLALACAGAPSSSTPRPTDWGSLDGRTLVPIAATGVDTLDIPSSSVEVSFTRTFPIIGANMISADEGCDSFISPGDSNNDPPSLDADGVLHVYGFVKPAIGCVPQAIALDWFMRFLSSGPHVTIDGRSVIFDSNGTTVTMTDKTGGRYSPAEARVI
jgi:hypothetical protein